MRTPYCVLYQPMIRGFREKFNRLLFIMGLNPIKKFSVLRTLYHGITDKRTPLLAKILPIIVVVYLIFPFDIIPDYIPLAGYLDDLIIVPLGLWLAIRMIPKEVLIEYGHESISALESLKRKFIWVAVIAGVVAVMVIGLVIVIIRRLHA